MWIDRNDKNLITEEEAKCLCAAIKERGEIAFNVTTFVLATAAGTISSAQRIGKNYSPNLRQKLLAKFNYTYTSVVSFVLWIGPGNVTINPDWQHDSKLEKLRVKLNKSNSVDWEKLENESFNSPLL